MDREEVYQQITPIAAVASRAFGEEGCVNLFSGKNVISPTSALDSLYTRIQIQFRSLIGLVGSPRDAETQGVGLLPSVSINPPGTYYKTVQIRIDSGAWLAAGTQERLLIFLHELGHVINFMSVGQITGGFVQDDKSPAVNTRNGELIQEKCINPLI